MVSIKHLDACNGFIAYGRFNSDDCAAVIINSNDGDIRLSVPVWELGVPRQAIMKREFLYDGLDFYEGGGEAEVKYGRLFVTLPAKSGCVYTYKFKD